MKKLKEVCRNIIIFLVAFGISILPTFIFFYEDGINGLFQKPEYWGCSVFIALVITWQTVMDMNNSND